MRTEYYQLMDKSWVDLSMVFRIGPVYPVEKSGFISEFRFDLLYGLKLAGVPQQSISITLAKLPSSICSSDSNKIIEFIKEIPEHKEYLKLIEEWKNIRKQS